ncbi:MAG: DUF1631 family protein [Polaromonas sp.]
MASTTRKNSLLAEQARALFAERAVRALPILAKTILERLSVMLDLPGGAREMQQRRDAWQAFQKDGAAWVQGTTSAWSRAQFVPATAATPQRPVDSGRLELMGDDMVEDKILASRLALRLLDFASWELNDLRLRIQHLEAVPDLRKTDIFRPEVLAQHLVEQWTRANLSRDLWLTVQDLIQKSMADSMLEIYHAVNEFLVRQGVMEEIDLRPLVRRTPSAPAESSGFKGSLGGGPGKTSIGNGTGSGGGRGRPGSGSGGGGSWGGGTGEPGEGSHSSGGAMATGAGASGGFGSGQRGGRSESGAMGAGSGRASAFGAGGASYSGGGSGGGGRGSSGEGGQGSGGGGGRGSGGGAGSVTATGMTGVGGGAGPAQGPGSSGAGARNSVYDETRLQTATTPLARARMRAQGVMGHLKRLLSNQVAGFDDTRPNQASPQLAQAIASVQRAEEESNTQRTVLAEGPGQVYGQRDVEQAIGALRARTNTLKQAATTSSEKATIEIVALMFQSILAEERIPPVIRVWFARLQMPVLRVAISEPEFFGSLQHPARRLIDRMGSCVLGFDVTISGGAIEAEVKRVVQVIEQYPETGRRVFQLVYEEFDKFLSRFLSEQGGTARLVSVAQQVEQKETMAIQYTIEMRKMLNDMPVREEIREFLFKIWAEVLAIAAIKNGPQHAETIRLKRAAADLVWAASAKPNRNDRARVIADLPKLLQLLRLGMSMLGLATPEQDGQLKIISDTLADAFMSKTDAIPIERIEAMAKRLTNLEDYLSDEDVGDLPLDIESLVTMIGIDAADIEVITDGGSHPTEAMRAWARELQLGAWFSLDHNGKMSHVQFAWCSERQQLHLFAAADGRNFLIQARRLAAYLQAGLLVPTEEEALTVRATRNALAKLDANPERLLG